MKKVILFASLLLCGCASAPAKTTERPIPDGISTTITTQAEFPADSSMAHTEESTPEGSDDYNVIVTKWGEGFMDYWYYLEIENESDKYLEDLEVSLVARDADGHVIDSTSHSLSPIQPHSVGVSAAGSNLYIRDAELDTIDIEVVGGSFIKNIREQEENVFSVKNAFWDDGIVSGEILVDGSSDYEYHPKATIVVRRDGDIVDATSRYVFDTPAVGGSCVPFSLKYLDVLASDDVEIFADVYFSATQAE